MSETWRLPRGFRFAGIHAGVRPEGERKDLALVVSDKPASAAGVFTQNRVCAAPVQVSRTRVPNDNVRGIVICSGNANACTGEQGLADAREMTELLAKPLAVKPEQVLVASTGIIGRPLPMSALRVGVPKAFGELTSTQAAFENTARAILTTDTCIKIAQATLRVGNEEITILGFAKGAAMIGPNMATLLAFVLTDATVAAADLQALLSRAAERSFNCISVEGHTSTNDTLLLLANGAAGGPALKGEELKQFGRAIEEVCQKLAQAIVNDAEGASKVLTLKVEGLRTEAECRRVAKAVSESALVKTALFGNDPNWGRIVSAAGYAGVAFEEKDLSLWLAGELLYDHGKPLPFDAKALSAKLREARFLEATLKFKVGAAILTFWTCDLSYDYVRLNADYTT